MPKKDNSIKVGMKIGDLFLIEEIKKNKKTYFKCECSICNRISIKRKDNIKYNKGMYHKHCRYLLKNVNQRFIHAWENMRSRTTNPNFKEYNNYGGRGINSDAYKYFIDFYDDLYLSYLQHIKEYGEDDTTLDRIDTNKNYQKDNLKWSTRKEQNENLLCTFLVKCINKKDKNDVIIFNSLKDCSNYFNIHPEAIKNRAFNKNKKFIKELGYDFEIYNKY